METHQRYIIWRRAKFQGIDIPDKILDVIDDQYFSKLVKYRIINVVIGLSAIPIYFILSIFEWQFWTFLVMTVLFTGVNLWQWFWTRLLLFKLRRDRDGRNLDT